MSIINRLRLEWEGLFRDLLVNQVLASPLVPRTFRRFCLRALGGTLDRCRIGPNVWIGNVRHLSIGRASFVNRFVLLDGSADIAIGADVSIGMSVSFITSTHEIGGHDRRAAGSVGQPIVIGDGSWIGARAVILPGVSIGPGTIVGAGAVVTHSCDSDSLYAGVPARLVRRLD